MSWSAITTDNLLSQLSDAEVRAVQTVSTRAGQADPVAEVLARGIAEVRGYIPALRGDSTLAAGLLPEGLHAAALDMVRARLCSRLPLPEHFQERHDKAAERALAFLQKVAEGRIAVEPPPVGEPPAAQEPVTGFWGSEEAFGN